MEKRGIQVIFKDWGKDNMCMTLTRKGKKVAGRAEEISPPLKKPKAEIVKTPTSFHRELKDV